MLRCAPSPPTRELTSRTGPRTPRPKQEARHQCPQHDITGALCLVATDLVLAQLPENITTAAQVLAGTHPPTIRARPTWDMPAAHANNAANAVVSVYKEEAVRHRGFTMASSVLTTALFLLASVGRGEP